MWKCTVLICPVSGFETKLAAGEGAGDKTVGFVGGDEDLVVVVGAELLKIEKDMVFVRHFQRDLFYGGEVFEYIFSHGVEGMLYGEAFVRGEGEEQVFADVGVEAAGVGREAVVCPGDVSLCGEDAVCCLL